MQTLITSRIAEFRRAKAEIEKKLGVKITISGKQLVIEGDSLKEYETSSIINAINSGFSAQKAFLLTEPDVIFKELNIKSFTQRKNLADVRARLIGTHGRTKTTIENLTGCYLSIKDNEIAVIGPTLSMGRAITAITSLIRGTKQANVYRFLENLNPKNKMKSAEDLGLRD